MSFASPAPAEDAEVKGRKIVMDAVAALGGDRFLAMRDRIEEGRAYSFFDEKLSGLSHARIYTRYLTPPSPPVPAYFGERVRQVFGKDETAYRLFDETRGYDVTFRGAKPIKPVDYESNKESVLHNILYILRMRLKEPGLIFESRGLELVNNIPVDVVNVIDSDNRQVLVYFEQSTHLPIRQVWQRPNPISHVRDEEATIFSKYRESKGVQWPWVVLRERNGERIFEMFAESVAIDNDLTDEKFTLPATVKIIEGEVVRPNRKK